MRAVNLLPQEARQRRAPNKLLLVGVSSSTAVLLLVGAGYYSARGTVNDREQSLADVKAQLQFTDVDLQACVSELFGINKLTGRGNLNVSLVASGSSPFGLASSLDGTAVLTGHDGAISRHPTP